MTAKRKALTTTLVRGLAPADQGEHYIVRDNRLPGFYAYVGSRSRTYYCEADYRDPYGRKKTKRLRLGDGNLMEAPEARNLAMLELGKIKSGGYTDAPVKTPRDATLRAAYDFYLERKNLAAETLRSYRKSFVTDNAPLRDVMDVRLADLASEPWQQELERRYHELKGKTPYLANRAFQNLNTVYAHGRKRQWKWLPKEGPTDLIEYAKEKRYEVPPGATPAAIWDAINKCDDPVTRSLWAATLLTGARPGEISRLRWPNVNIEARTAEITHTKTTESFKYVLSDEIVRWLRKCRLDDEFVFVGRHRKYRDVENVHLLPLPLGKFRNVYQAHAMRIGVGDMHLKMLVNHKVKDVTHGYAAHFEIQLPRLIEEQEKITAALTSA